MIKVRDSVTCRLGAVIVVAAWLIGSGLIAFAQTKNSCLDCHSNLPEPLGVSVETYGQNIHAQKGLTCAACHGGDASSDDPEKAMSRAAGWKGKIERKQIQIGDLRPEQPRAEGAYLRGVPWRRRQQ